MTTLVEHPKVAFMVTVDGRQEEIGLTVILSRMRHKLANAMLLCYMNTCCGNLRCRGARGKDWQNKFDVRKFIPHQFINELL